MVNSVRGVARRSVLKVLILGLAGSGCGEGEPVVVQAKSDKLDRIKGPDKKPEVPDAPKAK
jgi:hypothetical protein